MRYIGTSPTIVMLSNNGAGAALAVGARSGADSIYCIDFARGKARCTLGLWLPPIRERQGK